MKFRPTKSRGSTAPTFAGAANCRRRGERVMTAAAAPARDPDHVHSLGEHLGPAPKRIVTGYGFWIFILSDMVMFSCFFAAFAVLARTDRGRTERRGAVQPEERRDRDRLSSDVELRLRHGEHRRRCAQPVLVPDRDGGDLRAGLGVSFDRIPRIRRSGRARRRAVAQRIPVGVLHAWSAATACTSRPASCGC